MKECYLSLRELARIINMTPLGLSFIVNDTHKSENPVKVKQGNVTEGISIESERVNRKTVELNKFVQEHKMNDFEDIDYSEYLFKEVKKEDFVKEFGTALTPTQLKNIFGLTANDIKKLKGKVSVTIIETGIKGIQSKKSYYNTEEILKYLPDSVIVKELKSLFYDIEGVTELLNTKYHIKIKKLTVNRKIMKLPAIRIRKTIRIPKSLFDGMTKEEIETIFK